MSSSSASSASNHCVVPAVQLCSLTKNFGSLIALAGLDIEIGTGELFGFVGPDGAGKTTLLQILAGVRRSTSGNAKVFGDDPRRAKLRVGYLTQHFSLYSELSVDENLRYSAGVRNVSGIRFKQRCDELLARVGLSEFRHRIAGHLSGGMRQKLALCCVLISDPDLLLLDEPTTGLDPLSRAEVWQLIQELVSEGKTIVIATPHFDEAQKCSRVALMQAGSVLTTGHPADLIKELGATRLEIRCDTLPAATRLLISAQQRTDAVFNEMNVYGDRVDLISRDPALVESDIQAMLSQAGMTSYAVSLAEPTLENVYIASLRARGFIEPQYPQFPFADDRMIVAGEIAIEARDLTKRFGNFTAVDKVNLDIRHGEILGLLGANGAGKTTTIQMLTGLIKPTAGEILPGKQCGKPGSSEFRGRLGYMSQKFTLYDDLTVAENLAFYAGAHSIDAKLRAERIEWVLSMCDLRTLQQTVVGGLPWGLKQRIAFGASVLHQPALLFLDEPTAGLDPVARRQLWRIIRDFASHGCAVVVTTHFLDDAEYCHRLGLMVDGRLAAQGSPGEIKVGAGHQFSASLEAAFISIVRQTRTVPV